MRIRAVILDVYGTLLEVVPRGDEPDAGSEAEACWRALHARTFGCDPRLSWPGFLAETRLNITQAQDLARARGIAYPEIDWPTIVRRSIPRTARLPAAQAAGFALDLMRIQRKTRLAPHAARFLRAVGQRGIKLGIASNAQEYTLEELGGALKPERLSLDLFDPRLRFWSFEHGFSKPDPHVFQILNHRMLRLGLAPSEILMVGDRLDNDIAPAQAVGWATWQVGSTRPDNASPCRGGFNALLTWMDLPD